MIHVYSLLVTLHYRCYNKVLIVKCRVRRYYLTNKCTSMFPKWSEKKSLGLLYKMITRNIKSGSREIFRKSVIVVPPAREHSAGKEGTRNAQRDTLENFKGCQPFRVQGFIFRSLIGIWKSMWWAACPSLMMNQCKWKECWRSGRSFGSLYIQRTLKFFPLVLCGTQVEAVFAVACPPLSCPIIFYTRLENYCIGSIKLYDKTVLFNPKD